MKKEIATITAVKGHGVEYTLQDGTETGIYDPGDIFPGVEVGDTWEILVDYDGQFPAGKVIMGRRVKKAGDQ